MGQAVASFVLPRLPHTGRGRGQLRSTAVTTAFCLTGHWTTLLISLDKASLAWPISQFVWLLIKKMQITR